MGANSETDAGSFAINNAMMAGTIGVIATGTPAQIEEQWARLQPLV